MSKINEIYLRRKMKVIVEPNDLSLELPNKYIAAAARNLKSLGFTFSYELIQAFKGSTLKEFEEVYSLIVSTIKEMVGAHVEYNPMYPNFPQQVEDSDELELFFNSIIHYLTLGVPNYDKEERSPLSEDIKLKIIELGDEDDFYDMIQNLLSSKTSISETDRQHIQEVIRMESDVDKFTPPNMPHKENMVFLVTTMYNLDKEFSVTDIGHIFRTPTDVLRLAVGLSDGDISLSEVTQFRKFKRRERRMLLGLLNNCVYITDDMMKYKYRWIRLGEILHPGEYRNKYPRAYESFKVLRDNIKHETFNSKVESSIKLKDVEEALILLRTRPGELARRLDHLLRIDESKNKLVVEQFEKVAHKVESTVLLQILAHFKHRNSQPDSRVFFPKGNVAKAMSIENTLPEINEFAREHLVKVCQGALISKYKELDSLGKVYIDSNLKNYLVPFSQRSSSKSLRTIVRGSKIPLPPGSTVRLFTHWKNIYGGGTFDNSRVDIDLSSVMYDEDWNYVEHISYTNSRSHKYKAYHSGDITDAPQGASEFIDIDLKSVEKYGGRYVVMSLLNYTRQNFSEIPECFTGWMIRNDVQSGEIYEPSTVQDKFDLTAETSIAIPVILDVVKKEVIWCDMGLTRMPHLNNNIEGNQTGMVAIGQAMTSLVKPDLHELFSLHAMARAGNIVKSKEDADTIFSVEDGVTPFDIEDIVANYL